MQTQDNRVAVTRAFEEVFNDGKVDAIDELFQPDVVFYSTAHPEGVVHGIEEYKEFVRGFLKGFSDIDFDIQDMIAEGDLVAVRAAGHATHSGEYQGIPATGKRVHINEMLMVRGVDGKCAEAWSVSDTMSILQQLGVVPRGRPPRAVLRAVVGFQRLRGRLSRRRSAR